MQYLFNLSGKGEPQSYHDAISEMTKVQENGNCSRSIPTAAVAIYYSKFLADQTPDHILKTMIHQLMVQLWNADPKQAYDCRKQIEEVAQPTGIYQEKETVQDCLLSILKRFDQVYLIVDALDELSDDDFRGLLPKLYNLSSPTVKIMVAAREGLRSHAEHHKAYILEAGRNDLAIRSFVSGELDRIARRDETVEYIGPSAFVDRLQTEESRDLIGKRIVTLASGNFLCAQLQIRGLVNEREPDSLERALENLSSTLDRLMEDAMKRIERQGGRRARVGKQVILWAAFTRGSSIGLLELRHALSFLIYGTQSRASEFTNQSLVEATCYFLQFGRGSTSVTVHKGVKDYCLEAEKGAEHFEGAHGVIAKTCLECLRTSQKNSRSWAEWTEAVKASPLIGYAAANWGWHLAKAEGQLPLEPFPNLDFMDLLKSDRFLDTVTVAIQPQLEQLGIWTPGMWETLGSKVPPIPPLHVLTYFNLVGYVKKHLQAGGNVEALTKDSAGTPGHSALYVASILDNYEVVAALLYHEPHGADPIRLNGANQGTGFEAAVSRGHSQTVDTLLEVSSQELAEKMISRKNRNGETILMLACSYGRPNIVRQILAFMGTMDNRHNLLLHQGGQHNETALHCAVRQGEVDNGNQLLQFPFGRRLLEIPDYAGNTPLHLAAATDRLVVGWDSPGNYIKALLELGANPLSQNEAGETPTHVLVQRGWGAFPQRANYLKHLLPYSDLLIKNKKGKTVLHEVCESLEFDLVEVIVNSLGENLEILSERDNKFYTPLQSMLFTRPLEKMEMVRIRSPISEIGRIKSLISRMSKNLSGQAMRELLDFLFKIKDVSSLSYLIWHSPLARKLMEDGPTISLRQAILTGNDGMVNAVNVLFGNNELELLGPGWQTLVAEAGELGHGRVVEYLLSIGANIETPDASGQPTALWCAKLCDERVAKMIWDRNPNLLHPAKVGQTILNVASAKNPIRKIWREQGLLQSLDGGPREAECLLGLQKDLAVVVGSHEVKRKVQEDATLPSYRLLGVNVGTYFESNMIPATAKGKGQGIW